MDKYKNKKEKIMQAGIKSFAAYGYNKTTMEDIAEMLGMKKNSLYYYFENKDALFKAIIREEISKHADCQQSILTQNLPASEKLVKIVELFLQHIEEDSAKYSIKVKSFLEIGKIIKKLFPDFKLGKCQLLETTLSEGITSGEFKQHDVSVLASDINLMIDGIIINCYWNSEAEFVNEIDFDMISQKILRAINYIISGIKLK